MEPHEFKTEATAIQTEAGEFFHSEEIESLAATSGMRAVESHAAYKALVQRASTLTKSYNSDPDVLANRAKAGWYDEKRYYVRSAIAAVSSGPRLLKDRLKDRKRRQAMHPRRDAEAKKQAGEYVFASDVKKEYGVSLAALRKKAREMYCAQLAKLGLKNDYCDFNYDGADWGHHQQEVEMAKRQGRITCICQMEQRPFNPLGGGTLYGRKRFQRKDVERVLQEMVSARPGELI